MGRCVAAKAERDCHSQVTDCQMPSMLTRLLQVTGIATIALLLKRLLIRKKSPLPYRRPNTSWHRRSYREPS